MIPAVVFRLLLPGMVVFLCCTCLCSAQNAVRNGDFSDGDKQWGKSNQFGIVPVVVDVPDLMGEKKAIQFDMKDVDPKKNYLASLQQTLYGYIPKGANITLNFKAKGTKDKTIEAIVQLNGKPYTAIVNSGKLSLTDQWHAYQFSGTAKENFTPGSVRLYFPMGHNDGQVLLAGISVDMPDSGLPPVGEPLNFNDHFKFNQSGWWLPSNKEKSEWSFSVLGRHQIMKLDVKQGNPPKPWEVSITQGIWCNMPKNTHVKLLVRARSQTPNASMHIFLEGKDRHKERLVKLPDQKLSDDWQWFAAEAVMPRDYVPGDVRIVLQVGAMQQVLEFDQIALLHMAKETQTAEKTQ